MVVVKIYGYLIFFFHPILYIRNMEIEMIYIYIYIDKLFMERSKLKLDNTTSW